MGYIGSFLVFCIFDVTIDPDMVSAVCMRWLVMWLDVFFMFNLCSYVLKGLSSQAIRSKL